MKDYDVLLLEMGESLEEVKAELGEICELLERLIEDKEDEKQKQSGFKPARVGADTGEVVAGQMDEIARIFGNQ